MGGIVSNIVNYENADNESKAIILGHFKNAYSDKNIKELRVGRDVIGSWIRINDVIVQFTHEHNLIDFVCKLNRPFVFTNIESRGCDISFVYGEYISQTKNKN